MSTWSTKLHLPKDNLTQQDFGAGRSSTVIHRLVDLGVPAPDQVVYFPYSRSFVRGDLSKIGDGVARVEWTWDILGVQELSTLLTIFFDAVTDTYAHNRYIRTDLRTGDYADPADAFLDRKVTVWRPEVFGPDGTPVARSALAFATVRFRFTNLAAP